MPATPREVPGKTMRLTFCVLCGQNDPNTLEHHHYIPKASGGTDDEKNLITLCGECHGKTHGISRPLNLGALIIQGANRADARSVSEFISDAKKRVQQSERAVEKAVVERRILRPV